MVGVAEVIHGRWAMLGVAGATAPETMKGFIPDSTAVVWFKNGIIPAQGSYEFWAPADGVVLGHGVHDELCRNQQID